MDAARHVRREGPEHLGPLGQPLAPVRAEVHAPRVRSYHEIKFATEACSAGLSTNAEYDTATLRLGYSSLVDPPSTFSYDVKERELT